MSDQLRELAVEANKNEIDRATRALDQAKQELKEVRDWTEERITSAEARVRENQHWLDIALFVRTKLAP